MRRTTITLTDGQERALVGFAQPGPYQDELRDWARDRGIELNDSPAEAALVRLLIDAGIEHVRAHSADVAYGELAEVYVDEGITGEVTALTGDESTGDTPIDSEQPGDTGDGSAPAAGAPAGAAEDRAEGAGAAGTRAGAAGARAASVPAAGVRSRAAGGGGGKRVAR
jgi:hypothetical protein